MFVIYDETINNHMKLKDIDESLTYDGYCWRDPQYAERSKPKPVSEQKEKTTKKK